MSGRRITIVASELLGRPGTGGAGTADSLLAVALGRHGHRVRLLIASGRETGPPSSEWSERYAEANIEIQVLERKAGVSPPFLAPTVEVFDALRADPPEVVIADDWRGLAFAALRARQTALALTDTAFVIHCHGPGRVLTEFAQKVPDTPDRFGEDVTERSSLELADVVVSPTAWLLDWMRAHRWPVSASARVIPYVRQAAALGETPRPARAGERIRRLAFFGQLREGKGIRIFLAALESLEPALLDGVELVFLGSARGRWARPNIAAALPSSLRDARFETALDRETALSILREPGTLAVMPSLLDNAPNTVSECIEHGVPFVATNVGGIPELVADADRARVLCDPTAPALAAALEHALTTPGAPAHAARDPQESVVGWLEVVDSAAPTARRSARAATRVAVVVRSEATAERARRLATAAHRAEVEVVLASSRRAGFDRTTAEWVVFLDDDDDPSDGLLDALVAAQAAADADVVTAAVRSPDDPGGIRMFLGDPGSLGLLENHYGVLALLRSDLVAAQPLHDEAVDPEWPLLARAALAGRRVVSIPEVLSTYSGSPGRVGEVPGDGLAVLEAFEERPAGQLRDLPQLAATLGATIARSATGAPDPPPPVVTRLRNKVGLARR